MGEMSKSTGRSNDGLVGMTQDSLFSPLTASQLSTSQNEELRNYMDMGYGGINRDLRSGRKISDPYRQQTIKQMDSIYRKFGQTDTVDVVRLVDNYFTARIQGLKEGQSFTDKGFVSTSRSMDGLRAYEQNAIPTDSTVLRIRNNGAKFIDVRNMSSLRNAEQEVLFKRRTKFTVTKTSTYNPTIGLNVIEVDRVVINNLTYDIDYLIWRSYEY